MEFFSEAQRGLKKKKKGKKRGEKDRIGASSSRLPNPRGTDPLIQSRTPNNGGHKGDVSSDPGGCSQQQLFMQGTYKWKVGNVLNAHLKWP